RAIQTCSDDTTKAQTDCDQDQDTGVQGAQSTLSNFAVGAGAQGLGACSMLGNLIAGANAAVVYFAKTCADSRSICVKSCQNARSAVTSTYSANLSDGEAAQQQVADLLNTCKDLDAKIAQATQA